MDKRKIFELEIGLYNPYGENTYAEVLLPATPYEMLDVFDKARINDESIYTIEFISCKLDYLPQFLDDSVDLYELNHLAEFLIKFNECELNCFEGVVMMDAERNNYSTIAVEHLINMAHSVENCQIVYEAHNDLSLGKFYVDNDFVSEIETLPESVIRLLDYEKIGKEMRMNEGGVFTSKGYVVLNGKIPEIYQSYGATPIENLDYTILLHIAKKDYNDSEYGNDIATFLKLPANDITLSKAVESVGATYAEECVFIAFDCMIPSLTEKINDSLYESDGDSYGLVNELAQQLKSFNDQESILTYKAMIDVIPKDITLEDAIDFSRQVEFFSVIREVSTPAEYGRSILSKYSIECEQELFSSIDLYRYGKKLMEEKGVPLTEYGILWSETGQSLEQCIDSPTQHISIEMKWGCFKMKSP